MTIIIQPRRGSAAAWASVNPILAVGEMGFETDTKNWKHGDGVTVWTALPYAEVLTAGVSSVAGLSGTIAAATLTDALADGSTNKVFTAAEKTKLAGLTPGGDVSSVAGLTGAVGAAALTEALLDGTTKKVFTAAEKTKLAAITPGATVNSAESTAATASTLALRDANANLTADAFLPRATSTVTSATTVTLTVGSTQVQIFTGSTPQTVALPTTGVAAGHPMTIINASSAVVTLNSSALNLVRSIPSGVLVDVYALQATPTTAAHWYATSSAAQPVTPSPGVDTLTATVLNENQITVDWTTTRTDVTSWTIGRNGVDRSGSGPWSTTKLAADRTQTFNSLLAGTLYLFTLIPTTAAGDQTPVTVSATTAPSTPSGGGVDTAAANFGWGTEVAAASDDFPVDGKPNTSKWIGSGAGGSSWPGHNGNGLRDFDYVNVIGGVLTLEGTSGGRTGWIRQTYVTHYGRWEIRSRSFNTGPSGGTYHPLHLIWPVPDVWPAGGEYDWLEYTNPDQQSAEAFIHYPHPNMPVQQEYASKSPVDMTQWHNFGFEWTASGVKGYIDGVQWFAFSGGANANRSNIQAMPNGQLTIQLDNFTGSSGLRPAKFEIDWVKFYAVG